MKWWRQLGTQLQSQLNALLAPADDPRENFASVYERQRNLWLSVRSALTHITASKTRLEAKMIEVRARLQQLEDDARFALSEGREDMARTALRRQMLASVQVRELERQIRELRVEEERLSLSEQRLAGQLEAFSAQQEIIMARYSAAEAQLRLNEALSGISDELTDLRTALQEAEQKTEWMQARASAMDRLMDAGLLETPELTGAHPAEWSLRQEEMDRAITERLATMKQQMAASSGPASSESA